MIDHLVNDVYLYLGTDQIPPSVVLAALETVSQVVQEDRARVEYAALLIQRQR